jgi:hypothetical protein
MRKTPVLFRPKTATSNPAPRKALAKIAALAKAPAKKK